MKGKCPFCSKQNSPCAPPPSPPDNFCGPCCPRPSLPRGLPCVDRVEAHRRTSLLSQPLTWQHRYTFTLPCPTHSLDYTGIRSLYPAPDTHLTAHLLVNSCSTHSLYSPGIGSLVSNSLTYQNMSTFTLVPSTHSTAQVYIQSNPSHSLDSTGRRSNVSKPLSYIWYVHSCLLGRKELTQFWNSLMSGLNC